MQVFLMNLKSLFLTFSALPMLGFGLPSGAGISSLNVVRDNFITPTKHFYRQYERFSKHLRIEGKPNKRTKKGKKQAAPSFTKKRSI